MKQLGKILVIEDLEEWQTDLRLLLEDAGFYVEVVSDLEAAKLKMKHEIFHFITVDMNLKHENTNPEAFLGWDILQEVKKLSLHDTTPTMIITAFPEDYSNLHRNKGASGIFLMDKGTFDRHKFIEIVTREVNRKDLRFKDDHRTI